MIFCVYTMITLNSPGLLALNKSCKVKTERQINSNIYFSNHQ
ncbi:Mobile element protein [Richelia intracellularis]|nr:Mobile element protein [Richelia intracellularis]